MGVFDFVQDAGAKIGVGKSTKEIAAEKARAQKAEAQRRSVHKAKLDAAKKASAARAKVAAERKKAAAAVAAKKKADERARKIADQQKVAEQKEREREAKKGMALQRYVAEMGLRGRGLKIRYDDGVAFITGTVANRATKEKIILAVGNVSGVKQVRERMKVAPQKKPAVNNAAAKRRRAQAAAAQTMHTVKSGDTLSAISKKYLGDANRYMEIFKANQPMLTNPDMIQVGQVLRIPKG